MFHKYLILLNFISLFVIAFHASANDTPISNDEKAVFAYMKLTKQKPEFENWITNSELYRATPNYLKKKFLTENTERLKKGFHSYNDDEELLLIKRKIRLKTNVNKDNQRVLNTQFIENGFNETPYFPFPYGKESIALIATELDAFKTITLNEQEAPQITEYFYDSAPYEASMEITLRPLSADSEKPLFVDYKERWLMLGDIAHVRIAYFDDYKMEDITIWEYAAPWYSAKISAQVLETEKK